MITTWNWALSLGVFVVLPALVVAVRGMICKRVRSQR